MTTRYIVLKANTGAGTARRSARETVLPAPAELQRAEVTIDAADLTPQEVRDVRRDPALLRAAPVMPVMLVKPLLAAETAAAAALPTWGIEAVGAMQSPFTGAGVNVAVLDTGVDGGHEAFRGKAIVQKDFTGEGNGDQHGHGTHCAGTIFGGEVRGMRIGVAPGVSQAFIGKVLNKNGSGTTEQILDGILWAVRAGANIVSMSIGLDFPGLVRRLVENERLAIEPATSQALAAYRENVRLFDALAELVRAHSSMFANAIVVAAAGNESKRPSYEIATAPPAAADGFISVGALHKLPGAALRVGVASFSNALPVVSAPGVGVGSAKPGGGLATMNGTSMATPHVAGVAALWIEKIRTTNPDGHIRQLEGRLIGSATLEPLANPSEGADAGAGLVQAPRQ